MSALIKLAWRNVWRNKRRTAITLVSIGFGLAALLFQQSIIKSIQDQIVEKSTRTYSSHIQVQSKLSTDPKVPDARVEDPAPVYEAMAKMPELQAWAPKVIFTGLVSSALNSKGALVVGIDAAREPKLTIIGSYMVEGKYLEPGNDRQVMLGVKLAKELDVRLGEKLVVMVQGTDGSLSAEVFRVAGLFKTGSLVYDGQIVYIPLAASQRLLVCGEEVSAVSANCRTVDEINDARDKLAALLKDQPVNVLTWEEVSSEIVSIKTFQDAILLVVLIIIFAIVALGIFNTMLMSLFERIREFGLMLSLGAQPYYVSSLILIESLFLGALGVAFGIVLGCAVIFYFGKHGLPLPISDALGYWMPFDKVIYMRFAWKELALSSIAALFTSLGAALFPALRAARIKPVEALRHY